MMNTCRLTLSQVGQMEGLLLIPFQEIEFKLAVNIRRVLVARVITLVCSLRNACLEQRLRAMYLLSHVDCLLSLFLWSPDL